MKLKIFHKAAVVSLTLLIFSCGKTPADEATQTDTATGTETVVTTGKDILSSPDIESGIATISDGKDYNKPGVPPSTSSSTSTSSFIPSSIPPDPAQNSNVLVIQAPGTDFDFTGAQGVAKIRINQSTSEYKKIDLSGLLSPIGRNGQKVVNLKRIGADRLLLQDDYNRVILVSNDGTEVELTGNNFDAYRPNSTGDIFYVDQSAQMFRIASNSATATSLGSFPFDQINIADVSGSAVTYYGYIGNQSLRFAFFDGVNFSFANCNSGLVTAIATVGLAFNDCSEENFAFFDGTTIQKEKLPIYFSSQGFWHPDGAVVFSYNNPLDCSNNQAISFINREKQIRPIGCSPSVSTSNPVVSGDFFVIRGTSYAKAYAINSWQQDILTGFTPTKLSLAGTTLFYDGFAPNGSYVIGKIDIITKQQSNFNFGTTVQDLIAFQ